MTSGVWFSSSDIDFCIDMDVESGQEMVIVSDTPHTRNHAELLARHIGKFEEIIRDLESGALGAVAPPPVVGGPGVKV